VNALKDVCDELIFVTSIKVLEQFLIRFPWTQAGMKPMRLCGEVEK
jgi:hypothetical protein